jgi:formylglycine-generating enzyme required for sulfatase activity
MPVTDVSWFHAQAYAAWLSQKTGAKYRLLTEAEWEYAARAGARTTYAWGDKASHTQANYGLDECCGGLATGPDKWELSAPVGSFSANRFGLHDLSGNVWEWVEDCWEEAAPRPIDGSAHEAPNCQIRIMRGGSWASLPVKIRPGHREPNHPGDVGEFLGFRVARTD